MADNEESGNIKEMINLYSLPNEILIHILKLFTTHDLLPLTAVSHRFHALILRILHYRLLVAAAVEEYKLILECYHPSCKATEPYLLCTYLGTDGLSNKHEGQGWFYKNCGSSGHLGRLSALYSRFRPNRPEGEQRLRRRRGPPVGAVHGGAEASSNNTGTGTGANGVTREGSTGSNALVSHTVTLDEFEVLSQLCAVVNLVHRSAFPTCVNIVDGVIRLWREWLAEQARLRDRSAEPTEDAEAEDELSLLNETKHDDADKQQEERASEDPRILWVDETRNVGLKVRIQENKWVRDSHILVRQDNSDVAVSYEISFEELLIRTTRLLLFVEASRDEEQNGSKAIIFGTFSGP